MLGILGKSTLLPFYQVSDRAKEEFPGSLDFQEYRLAFTGKVGNYPIRLFSIVKWLIGEPYQKYIHTLAIFNFHIADASQGTKLPR
jgi:hypothetical protein